MKASVYLVSVLVVSRAYCHGNVKLVQGRMSCCRVHDINNDSFSRGDACCAQVHAGWHIPIAPSLCNIAGSTCYDDLHTCDVPLPTLSTDGICLF